jgi:phage-related baseplate assembly protein
MAADRVHIDRFQLRIEGLRQADANTLAREVVRRMADLLPKDVQPKRLNRLEMKVSIPWGTPKEHLAEEIADRICKGFV